MLWFREPESQNQTISWAGKYLWGHRVQPMPQPQPVNHTMALSATSGCPQTPPDTETAPPPWQPVPMPHHPLCRTTFIMPIKSWVQQLSRRKVLSSSLFVFSLLHETNGISLCPAFNLKKYYSFKVLRKQTWNEPPRLLLTVDFTVLPILEK